jgi:hypothetical protein
LAWTLCSKQFATTGGAGGRNFKRYSNTPKCVGWNDSFVHIWRRWREQTCGQSRGISASAVAQYYAIERFLFPLAQSQYRGRLNAAQLVLGHATPDMTLMYAERDQAAASRIAAEVG